MSTIGNVLRDADPIRTEPAVSSEQREAVRRAVAKTCCARSRTRSGRGCRFVRLAALLSVLVCILVLGWRLRAPVQPHTAVQGESQGLLRTHPPGLAPGLPRISRRIYSAQGPERPGRQRTTSCQFKVPSTMTSSPQWIPRSANPRKISKSVLAEKAGREGQLQNQNRKGWTVFLYGDSSGWLCSGHPP